MISAYCIWIGALLALIGIKVADNPAKFFAVYFAIVIPVFVIVEILKRKSS